MRRPFRRRASRRPPEAFEVTATPAPPRPSAPEPWREVSLPQEVYWRWRFTDAERRRLKAEMQLAAERFRVAAAAAEQEHQLACQVVRTCVGGDFDSNGHYVVDDVTCTVRRGGSGAASGAK